MPEVFSYRFQAGASPGRAILPSIGHLAAYCLCTDCIKWCAIHWMKGRSPHCTRPNLPQLLQEEGSSRPPGRGEPGKIHGLMNLGGKAEIRSASTAAQFRSSRFARARPSAARQLHCSTCGSGVGVLPMHVGICLTEHRRAGTAVHRRQYNQNACGKINTMKRWSQGATQGVPCERLPPPAPAAAATAAAIAAAAGQVPPKQEAGHQAGRPRSRERRHNAALYLRRTLVDWLLHSLCK
jgi:hypothetical protein